VTGSGGAEGHAGRFKILVLILAAQTVANVGPLGIPAIASVIRADLGLTLTQAGSFLSAYYVGPILMSLPAGTLADRWGVKQMLVLGQVVIALGLVAVAAAGSYGVLIVLMIFAGFGYGMLNPTSTKAVMGWFPPHQRATVVGLKQVGLPFGGVLGAALLPALALALGWRLAVVASAALIALGAVASLAIYRDAPDYVPPTKTPGERSPVSAVLRNRDLWLVALSTLVFAAMQTVWMAFLALYLQGVVGLTLLGAGDRFHELVGVDIALRWLIVARKRLEGRAENIVLVCCSAEHLPFPGGKFDAAVGLDVLEHAEDAPAVLSEAARTLRSGGLCYLATPNRFSIGPEPCVRLWGVGFLPRGLARFYVQQIRGVPYRQIRLLSFFDLRRLLRRSGLRHWRIAPAPVPLDASAGLSRVAQGLLRFYNALRGHPILARVLLIVGPYLQVVARPR